MADSKKKKNSQASISKNILKQLGILQDRMDSIYKDTYSANPQNNRDLEQITKDIETNITNIMSRNMSNSDVSQISHLYSAVKLKQTVNDTSVVDSINDFFDNKALTGAITSTYIQNKWIKELDLEIDTICKYMPILQAALDCIKDSVLSSDNMEKDYLNFTSLDTSPTELSKFQEEIKSYRAMYKLDTKIEDWYLDTSKYGETFLYKASYSKAIATLQMRKNSTRRRTGISEDTQIISESGGVPISLRTDRAITEAFDGFRSLDLSHLSNLKIEVYKDGVPLMSAIDEATHMRDVLPLAESYSINEASTKMDKIVPDEFELDKSTKEVQDVKPKDGLVDPNAKSQVPDIKVPGLLLRRLKHENIILLYIDDICLGAYYLEFINEEYNLVGQTGNTVFRRNNISAGLQSSVKLQDTQAQSQAVDNLLRYISSMIIQSIDDKFINDNPTLRDSIYSILKYNDIYNSAGLNAIRVTYIAPEDFVHIKFKEDPDTHRGQSDLLNSLIDAKLWVCLSLAIDLGILTRGQDKRVYYVKQNVETNIAQTLLTVINQIKKQNFNIMQIENMNSILGITGKYNDYIIPVGPSGDSPVQMEVMQGQDIDPQTELLDKLEERAVNNTGCVIDYVKARLTLDYASQLTMTNLSYMRFIYKRQSKFESYLGEIMTDIYNTEHALDNADHKTIIKASLSQPLFLSLNNLNQIIDSVEQQAQKLAQYEYPDQNDQDNETKKAIFMKHYIRYKLSGYLKVDEIENIKDRVELELAKLKKPENQQ